MPDPTPTAPEPAKAPPTRKTGMLKTATKPMAAVPAADPTAKLRQRLLLWIAILCVGLLIALCVRIVMKMSKPPPKITNIGEEFQAANVGSKEAEKQILQVESKAWMGETPAKLGDEDLAALKVQLKVLEDTSMKYDDLLRTLHDNKRDDSQEFELIVKASLELKLWVLDASELVESLEKKAPEYGGVYIPMYKVLDPWRRLNDELRDINIQRPDYEKDPAKKAAAVARLREIVAFIGDGYQKLADLQDHVRKGLTREDLPPSALLDLQIMTDAQNLMQMSKKVARTMISEWNQDK